MTAPAGGHSSGRDALADRMNDWKVDAPSAAVQAARSVQWTFERALYRVGIRGATTIGKAITRPFRDRTATVVNATGARFSFPAWDSYYGHYLFFKHDYEPELTMLLAAHAGNPSAAFLDCGANFGYWSVLARRVLDGPIAAIELNPDTVEWLRRNARAAERHIEVINAAVWDEDGIAMAVSGRGPSQAHHAKVATGRSSELLSRSIDSVVHELGLVPEHLVVKVDCEGAEIRAIAGAMETASRGACFALEDHGSDPECRVSRRLFELDWNVAVFTTAERRWQRVADVDAVKAIKTDPIRGYNVLAWSGTLQPALQAAFS